MKLDRQAPNASALCFPAGPRCAGLHLLCAVLWGHVLSKPEVVTISLPGSGDSGSRALSHGLSCRSNRWPESSRITAHAWLLLPCSAIGERLAAFFLPWRERYSLSPVSDRWGRGLNAACSRACPATGQFPPVSRTMLVFIATSPHLAPSVRGRSGGTAWAARQAMTASPSPPWRKQEERAARAEREHSEFVRKLKERMVEGARASAARA